MNIGSLNSAIQNFGVKGNVKKSEVTLDFSADLNSSAASKGTSFDNLVDKYFNITDSMPREGQISFAASIVANRVMQQGITGENEGFVKNIGNKFNLEEINTLKSEVRASALIKNKESHEIDAFLKNFDELIDIQNKTELESAKEQQAQPKYNNPADVFFRATMLMKGI